LSTAEEGQADTIKSIAREFVHQADPSYNQLTLTTFNHKATLVAELSHDFSRVEAGIDAMQAEGGTNIASGIISATDELLSIRHRPNAKTVLILITDGKAKTSADRQASIDAAEYARNAGVYIVTIGVGSGDSVFLSELASFKANSQEKAYWYAPHPADIARMYEEIIDSIRCP
jgi:Mg-chelatase subunit ChlD